MGVILFNALSALIGVKKADLREVVCMYSCGSSMQIFFFDPLEPAEPCHVMVEGEVRPVLNDPGDEDDLSRVKVAHNGLLAHCAGCAGAPTAASAARVCGGTIADDSEAAKPQATPPRRTV